MSRNYMSECTRVAEMARAKTLQWIPICSACTPDTLEAARRRRTAIHIDGFIYDPLPVIASHTQVRESTLLKILANRNPGSWTTSPSQSAWISIAMNPSSSSRVQQVLIDRFPAIPHLIENPRCDWSLVEREIHRSWNYPAVGAVLRAERAPDSILRMIVRDTRCSGIDQSLALNRRGIDAHTIGWLTLNSKSWETALQALRHPRCSPFVLGAIYLKGPEWKKWLPKEARSQGPWASASPSEVRWRIVNQHPNLPKEIKALKGLSLGD